MKLHFANNYRPVAALLGSPRVQARDLKGSLLGGQGGRSK